MSISDYTSSEYSLEGNRRVITGVITLEDVLEAVIKDEIVGQTDNFIDVNKRETAVRGRGQLSIRPHNFLTLLSMNRDQSKLSEAETAAACPFLSLNVPEFKRWRGSAGCSKARTASTVEDIEDDADASSKYVGTPSNNMDGDSDDLTLADALA